MEVKNHRNFQENKLRISLQ